MKRLALITGASAGIGAALAHGYAKRGFDIALTARREDRLRALAAAVSARWGAAAAFYPADLARPEAPREILEAVGQPLDVLVNNAGYGVAGGFGAAAWERQAASIQVMATAPTELAHRALPGMLARGYGRILNVASLAGLMPPTGGGLYSAIKAYMVRFSQALHTETAGSGVHVTALCPGFTYSEFHDVAGTRAEVSRMPGWLWQEAEPVAEAGIEACEANRAIVVTGAPNKAIAALGHVLPDGLALALAQRAGPKR